MIFLSDMEQRVSVPPGLPRPEPTVSYWQDPPLDIADCRTTARLPDHVDIVIIGGGITGATIAYDLLTAKPDLQILLLEARQAASGASGRNGRFKNLCLVDLDFHLLFAPYDIIVCLFTFLIRSRRTHQGRLVSEFQSQLQETW